MSKTCFQHDAPSNIHADYRGKPAPRSPTLITLGAQRRGATLDNHRAPDFPRKVEIHRNPGYDPSKVDLAPAIPPPKGQ